MSPLANRFVVITGRLACMTREVAYCQIEALGGRPAASVARSMHKGNAILIVGTKPGAKLARARAQNVPVISEWAFLRLLPAIEGQAISLIGEPSRPFIGVQGRSLSIDFCL